jgi:hypothetical protein
MNKLGGDHRARLVIYNNERIDERGECVFGNGRCFVSPIIIAFGGGVG